MWIQTRNGCIWGFCGEETVDETPDNASFNLSTCEMTLTARIARPIGHGIVSQPHIIDAMWHQ